MQLFPAAVAEEAFLAVSLAMSEAALVSLAPEIGWH